MRAAQFGRSLTSIRADDGPFESYQSAYRLAACLALCSEPSGVFEARLSTEMSSKLTFT